MQLKIEKIVYPGKSLAHHNGKIFFIDEGLSDEVVEIKPLKEKNNYTEAETIRIVTPSARRIAPRCGHYKICSGYQYIAYEEQLKIKTEQIKEIFSRALAKELIGFQIKPSPKIWGYRNKLHLHVLWDTSAYLAYHSPETHNTFVKIDGCFLASKEINNLLVSLLELINRDALKLIEEVEIKQTSSTGQMLLVIFGKKLENSETLSENLLTLKKSFPLAGIVYIEKGKTAEILLDGKNYIEERLNNRILRIGAQSFFQINIDALKLLLSDMTEKIQPLECNIMADLYCGIGTFGILFGDNAKQLISVESSFQNIKFLEENIRLNKLNNSKVLHGYSEELIPRILKEKIDILIIDPPRKGIGNVMCKNILENPVKYIFYVSCDPSTLARDLKMLLKGYNLDSVSGYDFFPHTPHIETFCLLARK